MKNPTILGLAVVALLAAAGCSNDSNQPQTMQQQATMAKGHPPTKEELDKAMSRFQAPPGPVATPPASAGGLGGK